MVKKYLNRVFIDGLSGMALGLFSTLIIGTDGKIIAVEVLDARCGDVVAGVAARMRGELRRVG